MSVVTHFPTNQDLDPAWLRTAFGIFPTGVVAVAAEVDGQLTGLAASSFTSVSLTDGLASFDTTIYREVEAGDHAIVLLRLHAVEHADDSLPLVFHRSGFGRLQHPA